MKYRNYTRLWPIWALVALAAAVLSLFRPVTAQESTDLRIVEVDAAAFPVVRVTLLTADGRSAPIANLNDLALREDGNPIADITVTNVPHGADFTFVIDANSTINQVDTEGDVSRLEKVRESIRLFADAGMSTAGLDRVSIIVPDPNRLEGQFLLRDATTAREVVDAIAAYSPEAPGASPIGNMLDLALEQAEARAGNGRYQAILLFSDAGRLAGQLSYPQLVARANDARSPIYVAILGSQADASEIDAAERLASPTRAFQIHMPVADASSAIYRIWQQQSNPPQVQYRSPQRRSGEHTVAVNLGRVQSTGSYTIALEPPAAVLRSDVTTVERVGTAVDTPLLALQPATLPVTLQLTWPDGQPRRLQEVVFLVDGESQPPPESLVLDAAGELRLLWDISEREEGTAVLQAQISDELGFTALTAPLEIDIVLDRPAPPTAEPEPTAAPSVVEQFRADPAQWLALLVAALLVIGGFFVFRWLVGRQERRAATARAEAPAEPPELPLVEPPVSEPPLAAALVPVAGDPIALSGSNMTLGRDAGAVQVAFDDPSVSRLHARIRYSDGRYWLYDEGSTEGTLLNYERLGLAPRPLQNGDTIQLGRVALRFQLKQVRTAVPPPESEP